MRPGYGSAAASAGILPPKMRDREKGIILERPAAYNFDSKHSKNGVDEKGAMSCCTTLAIVDRLHQITSRGIPEMGARSPSP